MDENGGLLPRRVVPMLETLLDLLAPPCCALCSAMLALDEADVCADCAFELAPDEYDLTPDGVPRFAAGLYQGRLRSGLLALKFKGESARGRPFGRLSALGTRDLLPEVDVVVPVPLGRARARERGYNQAALIAAGAARVLGKRCAYLALSRTRETVAQSSLDAAGRAGIAGAFSARRDLAGARVLLVDDVSTTGETAAACSAAIDAVGGRVEAVLTVAFAAKLDTESTSTWLDA